MMKNKKDCARQRLYPALQLWWDELRAGKRTKTTFDALWRAACEEMTAKEWAESGISELAEASRAHARRAISDRKGAA